MARKDGFVKFVQTLIERNPDVEMDEETRKYWEAFQVTNTKSTTEKGPLTDNGKMILMFMRDHPENTMWKSKDIADELVVASRTVAGAMRKLITDGYVEKNGEDPVIYTLTEAGKELNIEE